MEGGDGYGGKVVGMEGRWWAWREVMGMEGGDGYGGREGGDGYGGRELIGMEGGTGREVAWRGGDRH
jgi:hypothetical protein